MEVLKDNSVHSISAPGKHVDIFFSSIFLSVE